MTRSIKDKLADLVALTKPHIVMMSALMGLGGASLAPGELSWYSLIAFLSGTALLVGGASALNMVMERDVDGLMQRTKNRPLPAKRLRSSSGLIFGLLLSTLALGVLAAMVNPITAAVGISGLVFYLGLYTPLKRRTPLAVFVGAVAGALPPLMGWTASAGTLGVPGLLLFLTLFIWQVPHFLAISLYRREEYAKAGLQTAAVRRGNRAVWRSIILYSAALIPISLLLAVWGMAGWIYAAIALAAGLWLLATGVTGFREAASNSAPRARQYFRATLIYLPSVALALMIDRWLWLGFGTF